jgi:ribonuclease P protein component
MEPVASGQHERKLVSLRFNRDISRLFQEGQKTQGSFARILWLPNHLTQSRYALCVSKKWGGAVHRNRIKRVLFVLLQKWEELIPPGVDFAILPSPRQKKWKSPQLFEPSSILFKKFHQQVEEGRLPPSPRDDSDKSS